MPSFTGRFHTSLPLRLGPEAAAAAFADLDRQVACHVDLASADKVSPTTVRLRMKEMNHGPIAFAGRYTLVFTRAGNTVRWHTGPDSNLDVHGQAVFAAAPGGGCQVAYEEEVSMDMGLNRILSAVARPIAETMMQRGMRDFIERMRVELDRLT